ncbi:MAG: HAD family phosphatase [Ignavibacteria bacterium]|nr:HAD family phosphatase [Ignavibacteria bacterium]
MNSIKAIVFDLGNVLLPFDYSIMIARLDAVQEGLGEIFTAFYKAHYDDFHRRYERGDMSDEEFLQPIVETLQHKVDADTFCRFFSEVFTVNESLAGLLPLLRNNYRLILLSNTNEIHRQYGWKNFSFLENFEKLFLSHEVHAVKPEPAIYQAVMAYTGLRPEEHIFIDDVAEYAQGARDAGWDAIQFRGTENLLTEFSQRGIVIE